MFLTEINCKLAYIEFLKCINKDNTIHYFKFQTFLKLIIGNNIYKLAQKEFFNNLFRNSATSIRVIGTIIIFLSKGSKSDKIELLKTHFNSYYNGLNDNSIKEFVMDIIDANTDNCIVSFKSNLSVDLVKNMCDVYQHKRKRKLEDLILGNYDGVKMKYFNIKTNEIDLCQGDELKLNNSLIDDDDNNINNNSNINDNDVGIKNEKAMNDDLFINEDCSVKSDKMLKEFFELSYSQLNGEFIRSWLYDEYLKDKPYDESCF
jgi:hypothetical protein